MSNSDIDPIFNLSAIRFVTALVAILSFAVAGLLIAAFFLEEFVLQLLIDWPAMQKFAESKLLPAAIGCFISGVVFTVIRFTLRYHEMKVR